ncbi:MAG: hypothetical protein EP329_07440 [Deltaproteobacteria bacterium]|nr:MAG: hypothetical protein EP329_07440 [Deltaproteobacteria bacterium]
MTRTLALAALLSSLVATACTGGETGPAHPTDRLDYPVAVTADPSGALVWVTSGNFDLAWRGGAILAIDVATNRFVPGSAFEVGGFPGPLTLLERDGRAVAGYVLSRDEDALYQVGFSGDPAAPVVTCAGGKSSADAGTKILHCDADEAFDSQKVSRDGESEELTVGGDPYGALVRLGRSESEPDLLLTGAMIDGNVATWTLDADGAPTLAGNLDLFNGLYAMAESPTDGRVYTTTKSANIFQVLQIVHPDPDVEPDLVNPWLAIVAQVVVPEATAVDRARDIAVSSDGTRLYATYRAPSSLVIVDISDDAAGSPADRVIAKVPLASGAGDVVVVPNGDGTDRVYVSCYYADRVEVVDPLRAQVIAGIPTGDGPFGMAYVDNADLGVKRLYVAHFSDDSVGVIELDPASPYYHTEVAEIR